ncbi:hypothetical protein BDK51DRAFT_31155 [Blyttiomyces helicus]|uniref:Uncharacterized protein n=1 Tax=Blyttiomyces helicus TaxID=388810 RepID=A0A4P9WEK7_9FUNG|nr:hypothetical protein BDK51DRAFT_31155 [Blyttiomyces helicus]|eukprot:RKO91159.1 hypothetical protein BDK51DRAFT_31155 [Blyttiomyces helicus]
MPYGVVCVLVSAFKGRAAIRSQPLRREPQTKSVLFGDRTRDVKVSRVHGAGFASSQPNTGCSQLVKKEEWPIKTRSAVSSPQRKKVKKERAEPKVNLGTKHGSREVGHAAVSDRVFQEMESPDSKQLAMKNEMSATGKKSRSG